ncbi:hypothetical protein EVAR_103431_1 [Eumeta japonica]|uniref:Uncharacterized protein n=1 Tax=Eumeta variegata TaxID=151549 RepID=A0A4C1ZAP1_EUMVA|nr:hypothetical protein EVAR_103431_1 [Eumeta japonica]
MAGRDDVEESPTLNEIGRFQRNRMNGAKVAREFFQHAESDQAPPCRFLLPPRELWLFSTESSERIDFLGKEPKDLVQYAIRSEDPNFPTNLDVEKLSETKSKQKPPGAGVKITHSRTEKVKISRKV